MKGGWMGGLYQLCEWIYRLAYLNILWMGFCLLGGIVFGVFPATIAMFTIMKKWVKKEDFKVCLMFFQTFKKEFKQGNILGFLFLIVGGFIYIDAQLITGFDGVLKYILLGSFATLVVLYTLIVLYVAPVIVQYENGLFQHLKSALLLGVSFPFYTFGMMIGVASVLLVSFVFPAAALLYVGSGISFVITFFAQHLFAKVQNGNTVLKASGYRSQEKSA